MELDVLKHFVNRNVEVLVAGVWIEGHMQPIVKSVITLLPFPDTASFYGATAVKAENVQAVREVKRTHNTSTADTVPEVTEVRSSLDQVTPGQRFGGRQ